MQNPPALLFGCNDAPVDLVSAINITKTVNWLCASWDIAVLPTAPPPDIVTHHTYGVNRGQMCTTARDGRPSGGPRPPTYKQHKKATNTPGNEVKRTSRFTRAMLAADNNSGSSIPTTDRSTRAWESTTSCNRTRPITSHPLTSAPTSPPQDNSGTCDAPLQNQVSLCQPGPNCPHDSPTKIHEDAQISLKFTGKRCRNSPTKPPLIFSGTSLDSTPGPEDKTHAHVDCDIVRRITTFVTRDTSRSLMVFIEPAYLTGPSDTHPKASHLRTLCTP
jgi:hypothetical protein